MLFSTIFAKLADAFKRKSSSQVEHTPPKYTQDEVISEPHILVIEDIPKFSNHLQNFFKEKGYKVIAIEGVHDYVHDDILIGIEIETGARVVINLKSTIAATVDFSLKGNYRGTKIAKWLSAANVPCAAASSDCSDEVDFVEGKYADFGFTTWLSVKGSYIEAEWNKRIAVALGLPVVQPD